MTLKSECVFITYAEIGCSIYMKFSISVFKGQYYCTLPFCAAQSKMNFMLFNRSITIIECRCLSTRYVFFFFHYKRREKKCRVCVNYTRLHLDLSVNIIIRLKIICASLDTYAQSNKPVAFHGAGTIAFK